MHLFVKRCVKVFQTPADPINHNDTPRFYSIKLLAKIKMITKMNNWTYISVITYLKWPKPYFGKLYWKCNLFFYFDWSPIRLHGEGGVYDLYCSQPPGGDQRARSFTLKDEWDTPERDQAATSRSLLWSNTEVTKTTMIELTKNKTWKNCNYKKLFWSI